MRFVVDASLRAMDVPRALARWAVLWVETRFRLSFRAIVWWALMAPLRVTPAVLIERNGCSMSRNAFATTLVLGCSIAAPTMSGGFRTFLDGWRFSNVSRWAADFRTFIGEKRPRFASMAATRFKMHVLPPVIASSVAHEYEENRLPRECDDHAITTAARVWLPRDSDYCASTIAAA